MLHHFCSKTHILLSLYLCIKIEPINAFPSVKFISSVILTTTRLFTKRWRLVSRYNSLSSLDKICDAMDTNIISETSSIRV